jgi:hypothetical protein
MGQPESKGQGYNSGHVKIRNKQIRDITLVITTGIPIDEVNIVVTSAEIGFCYG